MSNDSFQKFARFLTENPGSTANEMGMTSVDANRLEAAGKIVRVGSRQTGKPGRRPIEYALPGQEGVTTDARVTAAQDKAKHIVQEHDAYDRIASSLWRMRDNHGMVAAKALPEYQELEARKIEIRARYDGNLPPAPTANQMMLAGVQTVGAPIADLPVQEID